MYIGEDSFFFAEFLGNYFKKLNKLDFDKIKCLDVGAGTGILAKTVIKLGIKKENVLVSDINQEAVNNLKENLKINAVKSDLFEKISRKEKFDFIFFNAPYLPEDENEPKDSKLETTGGKRGDEISLKFFKQAKEHLIKNGKIFLLISSNTPIKRIEKLCKNLNFKMRLVKEKNLFFEKLLIFEFILNC